MNPLEPNDPLWKLLGQSREVGARPHFARNVVRAARHTPQQRGWLARLRAWWEESDGLLTAARGLTAVAAVVVLAGLVSVSLLRQDTSVPVPAQAAVTPPAPAVPELTVVEAPLVRDVETQMESLDYLDALLAVEDTSGLSDKEIAYLLY